MNLEWNWMNSLKDNNTWVISYCSISTNRRNCQISQINTKNILNNELAGIKNIAELSEKKITSWIIFAIELKFHIKLKEITENNESRIHVKAWINVI